jgi:hypothetical protein
MGPGSAQLFFGSIESLNTILSQMNFNIVELVEPIVNPWRHFFLHLVEASALGDS